MAPRPPLPRYRRVAHAAAIVGCAYLGTCAVGAMSYRHFLYPAPVGPKLRIPSHAELWTLRADDGVAVHALHVPPDDAHEDVPGTATGDARYVVYFHGNGETISDEVWIANELVRRGLHVVLAEYRGYGVSRHDASPSEAGLYADAVAVLDKIASLGVPSERVTLWGASLGSGVASEMALRGRAHALVLFTPYTSIPDVAARWVPGLPMSILVRDRFATLDKAKDIHTPTLIVHGTADTVVPYDMGATLSLAFPRAHFVTVRDGGHMDLLRRDPSLFDAVALLARGEAG